MTSEQRLQSFHLLDGFCAVLRTGLGLGALGAGERRRLQGKWSTRTKEISVRAAALREQLAEYLPQVPYRGPDIDRQRQRVEVLEQAVLGLDHLAQQARD